MMPFAERGSIWTVPRVSRDATCVIASHVRGVERGRPEYHVVPLYFSRLIGAPSTGDFLIRATETDLGVPLYAAIWNARPMLHADLGKQVGRVQSDAALRELRDAQLQVFDPRMRVAPGRLGTAEVRPMVDDWRKREMLAWLPLTARALTQPVT